MNADGSHKLKCFVLGKFKNSWSFKNTLHLPLISYSQRNGWMTLEISRLIFCQQSRKTSETRIPDDCKSVLLVDNCRAHPPASELVCGNSFVTYLPADVTYFIQLMDQGVIQNFKKFYTETSA